MATWRHVETPVTRGQSTTMTRGDPPDTGTKPWVSPMAIWFVCLFNRQFSLQETGPGRGVDACWLLGSIQPTGPITPRSLEADPAPFGSNHAPPHADARVRVQVKAE